jgi:uncharacterized protein YbjT (DUF2867 family)
VVTVTTAPAACPGYAPAVARLLILGGGRRGLWLAREVAREGHATRVVTRAEARRDEIEAVGAECWIGDPDRLGTLRGALEGVTIVCWLLGSASGSDEDLKALHGPRLRSFLGQAIDTTVRGILYEAAGSVPADVLAAGAEIVRSLATRNAIPLAVLVADPTAEQSWRERALAAVGGLLRGEGGWPPCGPEPFLGQERAILALNPLKTDQD